MESGEKKSNQGRGHTNTLTPTLLTIFGTGADARTSLLVQHLHLQLQRILFSKEPAEDFRFRLFTRLNLGMFRSLLHPTLRNDFKSVFPTSENSRDGVGDVRKSTYFSHWGSPGPRGPRCNLKILRHMAFRESEGKELLAIARALALYFTFVFKIKIVEQGSGYSFYPLGSSRGIF